MTTSVAVLVDIVDSRSLADRAAAQGDFETAFARANALAPALRPLEATVGDEFQGVWPDLPSALIATLAARLALPHPLDCRFGLGIGDVRDIPGERAARLQDGEGWTLARAAIDRAHEHQATRIPSSRSWIEGRDPERTALVNAYLLARDDIVTAMRPRERRLAFGRLLGRRQPELAAAEGISQSAVSQALRSSGAPALLAGIEAMLQASGDGAIT